MKINRYYADECRVIKQHKDIKFDLFVTQFYLPFIKMRKRSWKMDERICRKHLSPVFGERPLCSVTQEDIESWLHSLAESGLAPSSCNRFLSVLKTIFSLAEERFFLCGGQSPCNGIAFFKVHTQRERYLSYNEANNLMEYLKKSDRIEALALQLLILTGARKSEILQARWKNVNLEQRILTVPLSKSGKPRYIALSAAAVEVIRALPRQSDESWLFPGHAKNKPLSDIYLFWDETRRALGLADVRIHDLRHTFASFLVNSGHSLYEVQKLLGHADPRTTMRYAHLGQESLLAAAEAVSGIFTKAQQDDLTKATARETARAAIREGD